jgi:hypothetical protein
MNVRNMTPPARIRESSLQRCILLAATGCLYIGAASGQYWERTYGGLGADRLAQVASLSNGSFVAAGSTGSFGPGGGDVYVLLLEEDGTILRSVLLGGPGVDAARAVAVGSDGIAVAGTRSDANTGDYNIGLWGLDASGDVQWERSLGSASWDFGVGITARDDGWTVLAHSYANGAGDALLYRLGPSAEVEASMFWGGADEEVPAAIAADPLGGVFITGTRHTSLRDAAFLVKFNDQMVEQWSLELQSDSSEYGHGVTLLGNGDLLVSGSTREQSADLQMFIARFDASGNLLWKRVYGQNDDFEAFSALERPDGGLAVIGYTKGFGLGGKDFYLLMAEPEGWFQQGLTFGSGGDDEGRSICATENGFLLGGTTEGYGPGPAAFHLIRTNAAGSTEGAQVNTVLDPVGMEERNVVVLGIAPNPVGAGAELTVEHPFQGGTEWHLMDALGTSVAMGRFSGQGNKITLPSVSPGMYSVRINDPQGNGMNGRVLVVPAR